MTIETMNHNLQCDVKKYERMEILLQILTLKLNELVNVNNYFNNTNDKSKFSARGTGKYGYSILMELSRGWH
jgi:hypothetical protein